jgi:ADP-L-glycero-D-manno-heptose 6-epimerase
MILVTGGAGFIGSNLQARLYSRGIETIVADRLGSDGRWRNLAAHPPARLIAPDELPAFLAGHPKLQAIFHLGAISDTTVSDADLTWRTNVGLSETLLDWCAQTETRLIYASSAATYGDGANGFDDDPALLPRLRPLNLYGWTKHVFDRLVASRAACGRALPPQVVGLKFFNVYGPNEYHKGHMISVVKRKYDEIAAGGPARLFRSDRPGLPDGAQARDFIHVDDVVDVMLWLLATPTVSGLFNVGTGSARTYLDLANAVADAAGQDRRVEFVDMPAELRGQYQSFTQASTDRLRAAGYPGQFTTLEAGIARYVRGHLARPDPYL